MWLNLIRGRIFIGGQKGGKEERKEKPRKIMRPSRRKHENKFLKRRCLPFRKKISPYRAYFGLLPGFDSRKGFRGNKKKKNILGKKEEKRQKKKMDTKHAETLRKKRKNRGPRKTKTKERSCWNKPSPG